VRRAFARDDARRSAGVTRGVSSVFEMKKQLLIELIDSIKEAGQVHRGAIRASREFVVNAQDVVVREELRKSESGTPGN
jgi:hypothetical protein